MKEKVTNAYTGVRTKAGCWVRTPDLSSLPLRLDLQCHSPTGFEWGYGGSGPAQLALALLAHCMDDETALRFYHEFTRKVIAALPRDNPWEMTCDQIREVIGSVEKMEVT